MVRKKKKQQNDGPITIVVRKLWRSYQSFCKLHESAPSQPVAQSMLKCIEVNQFIVRFIIIPYKEILPLSENKKGKKGGKPDLPVIPNSEYEVVYLLPLISAIRELNYSQIKDLHVWNNPLSLKELQELGTFLQKPFYDLRQLELMDCFLTAEAISQITSGLSHAIHLTTVSLDYNEFGDEGCELLCKAFLGNKHLLTLSLNYCDLTEECAKYLAQLISKSSLQNLYIDGNDLGCEGSLNLIRPLIVQADIELVEKMNNEKEIEKLEKELSSMNSNTIQNDESKENITTVKKKKKKKKKKKSKKPPKPPRVGPWLERLHISDNAIDAIESRNHDVLLMTIQAFAKLIRISKDLKELDLDDNVIGELGGLEILRALQARKEAKLPNMKLRVTNRMNAVTFKSIFKLATGINKKKKRKGKKKKKK